MTERQALILAAIIEQYAEVASPVGSSLLAKVFNVSSATIRTEMFELESLGYIKQTHTSSGRVPTDKGYRYYVNNVVGNPSQSKELVRGEKALITRVKQAGVPERMIKNAVDTLVELTHNLGLATIGDQLYISGLSNLFNQPEFMNGQVLQVARLLDNLEPWIKEVSPNQPLSVYIGQENPIGRNADCTLIISKFRGPFSDQSYIGTLGSTRQSYREVMYLVQKAGLELEKELF